MTQSDNADEMIDHNPATELASNRTAMSFERTGMSADRTLMSVVRTSLSLISFGFTIFQFFHTLNGKFLDHKLPDEQPRNFGLTLIILGVILLIFGIWHRREEAQSLRERRKMLSGMQLIRGLESNLPSSAMVIAILLLIVGLLAISSIAVRIGPF